MNLQNFFGGFHGAAVAAVAEAVSIACARTVVSKDKEIFLGELSISYLASAKKNLKVIVDACISSVVRSGRNLSVIALEFKLKKTGDLIYIARATFYHMPAAKLLIWTLNISVFRCTPNSYLYGSVLWYILLSFFVTATHWLDIL
ncbi:uncharacterized protein LOC110754744 [Prunus avium]|uniref:Uncharacterized protein LOC110754744 n=1 Tax=Prunus avium TaxID=42229 RepID=A0A6P5S746_PRUAV|nr:uncharacterized protein LOC110754744 [Prunus avium]